MSVVITGSMRGHTQAGICPECGGDCREVALIKLVYTFEVCNCGKIGYAHLVEQLHHRSCFSTED